MRRYLSQMELNAESHCPDLEITLCHDMRAFRSSVKSNFSAYSNKICIGVSRVLLPYSSRLKRWEKHGCTKLNKADL